MKTDWPCKTCADRYVGCHAECIRYAAEKAERARQLEAQRRKQVEKNEINDYIARHYDKVWRKNNQPLKRRDNR